MSIQVVPSARTFLATGLLGLVLSFHCGGGGSGSTTPPPPPTPVGPHLSTVPGPQAGYPGDTVTFRVVADGTGNSYQWLRNGSTISGATADTYALPVQLTDDQAHYSVRVTASGGGVTTSPDALLDVLRAYPAVVCGQDHTLAITTKGLVYAWGYNGHGQLGVGDNQPRQIPTVVPLPGPAVQLAAGWGHSMALLADGRVFAWGYNGDGELGDGTLTSRTSPAPVPGLVNIIAIASGYYHAFAYASGSAAWIWGYNNFGQLGLNDTVTRTSPQPIAVGPLLDLAMGRSHTLMVTNTGALLGCGDNTYGSLGQPASMNSTATFMTIYGSGVAGVRTCNYSSVYVSSTGQPFVTGENVYGGLGDNTYTTRYGFWPMNLAALPAGSTLSAVVPGVWHTFQVTTQGAVTATGYNYHGQLGLGAATPTSYVSPQLVPGLTAAGIYAGYQSSFAVMPDLSVKAWGYNSNGRLGDGTTTDRNSPTTLVGFSLGPVPTGVPGVRVGAKDLDRRPAL